jgi:hypothetical protein
MHVAGQSLDKITRPKCVEDSRSRVQIANIVIVWLGSQPTVGKGRDKGAMDKNAGDKRNEGDHHQEGPVYQNQFWNAVAHFSPPGRGRLVVKRKRHRVRRSGLDTPGIQNTSMAIHLESRSLSTASDSKAYDRRKHVQCVANEMNLASGNIKPINRVFNDSGSELGKSDEKLDIEGKSLLMKPILDGFVTFASHNFEAALRIVYWNAGSHRYEGCKEPSSHMPNPRTLYGPAKNLAARAEESVGSILAQSVQDPEHFVWRNRTVCVKQGEPFRFDIEIPA